MGTLGQLVVCNEPLPTTDHLPEPLPQRHSQAAETHDESPAVPSVPLGERLDRLVEALEATTTVVVATTALVVALNSLRKSLRPNGDA